MITNEQVVTPEKIKLQRALVRRKITKYKELIRNAYRSIERLNDELDELGRF